MDATEVYPEHFITGCAPTDNSDRTLQKKRSDGTLLGALLAGNEYEAVCLIKAGVEANIAENTTSPLHVSVGCITSTVTKLLIAHGADVNARNDVGETALHLAAGLNHINAVRLLLCHGAVVNVQSRGRSYSKQPKSEFNRGWTPLHEAFEQGNEAITRELLSNGAHVDVRTATGRSPLDLAVENNHEQIQLLFREATKSKPASERRTFFQRLTFNSMTATESLLLHLQGLIGQGGEPSKLCSICAQLKQMSEEEIARSSCHCVRYDSISHVRRSVAAGCPLCCLLLDCLNNHSLEGKDETAVYLRSGTTWYASEQGGAIGVIAGLFGDDFGGEDVRHSIQLITDPKGKEAPDFFGLMRLSSVTDQNMLMVLNHDCSRDTSTGSMAAAEMAATWLLTCIRKHSICSNNTETLELPTRVLDVGSSTQIPFLCVSGGKAAHYIALSYTWGGHVPLTTTSVTFAKRKKGIPFENLPLTFKHAVLFCRALGVQYLWIDALCIIQDSEKDWACEAGKMARFFHNSLLTLTASDSASPLGGLFRERLRKRCRPYLLEPRIPFRNRFELGPGALCLVGGLKSGDGPRKPRSVLDTRCWILQEQILSTRTLTFSKGELYWDCMCLNASERHPMGIPLRESSDMRDRDVQVFKEYVYGKADLSNRARITRFHICWRTIVEMYTERELTKAKDKLHAFQGITNTLKDNLGVDVLAGQIATDVTCLAWKVKGDFEYLPMLKAAWRAPSWSWASIDAAIEHAWYSEVPIISASEPLVEFVDFPKDVSSQVDLSNAPLHVRGRLIPATLCGTGPYHLKLESKEAYYQRGLKGDAPVETKSIQAKLYPDTKKFFNGQVWAINVLRNGAYVAGLCLISSGKSGEFERFGVYNFKIWRLGELQHGSERTLTLV